MLIQPPPSTLIVTANCFELWYHFSSICSACFIWMIRGIFPSICSRRQQNVLLIVSLLPFDTKMMQIGPTSIHDYRRKVVLVNVLSNGFLITDHASCNGAANSLTPHIFFLFTLEYQFAYFSYNSKEDAKFKLDRPARYIVRWLGTRHATPAKHKRMRRWKNITNSMVW